MKPIDLTGKVFGRWTVLRRAPDRGDYVVRWECQCRCGTLAPVTSANLRRGISKGCRGCCVRRVASPGAALRGTWNGMKSRCERREDPKYPSYGGRGIRVCDRWKKFSSFYEDVGNRPSPKHTLERLDNDGNYEPGNVVWAPPLVQANNRRTSLRLTIGTKTQTLAQWCRTYGAKVQLTHARLQRGWELLRALTEPAGKCGGDTRQHPARMTNRLSAPP